MGDINLLFLSRKWKRVPKTHKKSETVHESSVITITLWHVPVFFYNLLLLWSEWQRIRERSGLGKNEMVHSGKKRIMNRCIINCEKYVSVVQERCDIFIRVTEFDLAHVVIAHHKAFCIAHNMLTIRLDECNFPCTSAALKRTHGLNLYQWIVCLWRGLSFRKKRRLLSDGALSL